MTASQMPTFRYVGRPFSILRRAYFALLEADLSHSTSESRFLLAEVNHEMLRRSIGFQ